MTDDIDNDGTTLHESGGVVQPTDAQIHNPWRESLENCITGDNYLRSTEWRQLIEELDRLYAIEALAVPEAPLQAEPVIHELLSRARSYVEYGAMRAYEGVQGGYQLRDDAFLLLQEMDVALAESPAVVAEPVPVVASEPAGSRVLYGDEPFDEQSFTPLATPQAEPAVAEQAREAKAMRMLWDDQQPEEKAHYRAVAGRAAMASQSTPPPESAGQGLSDAEICEVEHAVEALRQIAGGQTVIGDTVERVADIRRARGIATIAHRRLDAVLSILAANPTAQPDGGSKA